ncbi:MAG: M1 family peptidase [Candidatus Melainabacteria bacterium]|nr:MAG: M1 family peptidase [Candidatus Melainabacteria bacterium]
MSKDTTAVMDPETVSYRLPRNVVPEKYEIKIEPDLVNFRFDGEELIHVTIAEPVREIILNALELELFDAFVTNNQQKKVVAQIRLDAENERAILSFPEQLESGSWKLSIKFKGILNDKLHGFYRSTYKDPEGQTKVIATTQFEATDARRAFPCFDEPDFKAVYRVTLIVDRHLTAISNAKIRAEKLLPSGKKVVRFNDTMKMSTYLVAFIVGEFEATEIVDADGTPVRIWTRPGQLHLAKFAEGIAVHALTFFNSYYGLKYPGDKLELIAIPDFAFGAMENLGAVTFRDTALLVDEKTASHAELERVADVVAHEIAHMWFGDLATMSWWNGIWLNEAFATFMEMLAVDSWKPNWKRWESFGVSRASAFATDGLRATRTIEFPVKRPEEAQGMFDVLTYEKGASVLRMLEQYLGAEPFRRGISLYLSKHKYANTETTDLWDAIEESTKEPVRQMMDSWIYQEGHPMITVESINDGKSLSLTQQRFMYFGENAPGKDTLFHVPIMLKARTAEGHFEKKVILTGKSTTVDLPAKLEWVVVNDGGHGFYRVRYGADLLKTIMTNINQFAPIERFNLVNDSWAAVLAGLMPLQQYLDMIRLFIEERDKNVWTVILGSLQYLDRLTADGKNAKTFEPLQKLTRTLFDKAYKRFGWENKAHEDELTKQLRGMIIGALGTLGEDEKVQEQAGELFERYLKDRSSVSTDIAPALVTIMAHTGAEDRYSRFVHEFKTASTPQEEDRFMYALSAFRNEKLLKQTLEKTLNGEVRTQNAPYLVRQVMLNPFGRKVSWEFINQNYPKIKDTFPEVSITRMFEGITGLVESDYLPKVTEFLKEHPVKQGQKTVAQHLEKLQVAIAFKDREKATLQKLD